MTAGKRHKAEGHAVPNVKKIAKQKKHFPRSCRHLAQFIAQCKLLKIIRAGSQQREEKNKLSLVNIN